MRIAPCLVTSLEVTSLEVEETRNNTSLQLQLQSWHFALFFTTPLLHMTPLC